MGQPDYHADLPTGKPPFSRLMTADTSDPINRGPHPFPRNFPLFLIFKTGTYWGLDCNCIYIGTAMHPLFSMNNDGL